MYIDPSSGGLLFQVLLIAFGVISGTILVFSGKIKMAFARLMRKIRERADKETPSKNQPIGKNTDLE